MFKQVPYVYVNGTCNVLIHEWPAAALAGVWDITAFCPLGCSIPLPFAFAVLQSHSCRNFLRDAANPTLQILQLPLPSAGSADTSPPIPRPNPLILQVCHLPISLNRVY